MINLAERIERLNTALERGEVLRSRWMEQRDGRELACLLGTLAPEVGNGNISACPADLMPQWFANIVPWIDDAGSEEAWAGQVKRFAALLSHPGYRRLNWKRFRRRCLLAIVNEAKSHTVAACDGVLALLNRSLAGDEPSRKEWRAASEAAWAEAAASEAASADQWAASAAASAAWADQWAEAAAEAARAAAEAAEAAEAAWAEARAAADRIIAAILDAMALECEAAIAKETGHG